MSEFRGFCPRGIAAAYERQVVACNIGHVGKPSLQEDNLSEKKR